MNTKNMLIILFIAIISVGLFALYRHMSTVNQRLSLLENIITREEFENKPHNQNKIQDFGSQKPAHRNPETKHPSSISQSQFGEEALRFTVL